MFYTLEYIVCLAGTISYHVNSYGAIVFIVSVLHLQVLWGTNKTTHTARYPGEQPRNFIVIIQGTTTTAAQCHTGKNTYSLLWKKFSVTKLYYLYMIYKRLCGFTWNNELREVIPCLRLYIACKL